MSRARSPTVCQGIDCKDRSKDAWGGITVSAGDKGNAPAGRPSGGLSGEASGLSLSALRGSQDLDLQGLGAFLALTALGVSSIHVQNAVAVLSDLLPLQSDLGALLGLAPGTADINWSYARPGLTALLILLLGASMMPSFAKALNAAGDILPFPADLQAAITHGTDS